MPVDPPRPAGIPVLRRGAAFQSAETKDLHPATRELAGWPLWVARLAWTLIVAWYVGMLWASLPVHWQVQMQLWRPQWAETFARAGLSAQVFVGYTLAWELASVAAMVAGAAVIAWGRAPNGMALFTALVMATSGIIHSSWTLREMQAARPEWAGLIATALAAAQIMLLLLLYTLPDGRFVPRGTPLILAGWAAWMLVGIFAPALSLEALGEQAAFVVQVSVYGTGVAALIHRSRQHSTPAQRQQLKWLLLGFVLVLDGMLVPFFLTLASRTLSEPALTDPRPGPAMSTKSLWTYAVIQRGI